MTFFKYLCITMVLVWFSTQAVAEENFNDYVKGEMKAFNDYKDSLDKEFSEYLNQPWKSFDAVKSEPKLKPKPIYIEPVVIKKSTQNT